MSDTRVVEGGRQRSQKSSVIDGSTRRGESRPLLLLLLLLTHIRRACLGLTKGAYDCARESCSHQGSRLNLCEMHSPLYTKLGTYRRPASGLGGESRVRTKVGTPRAAVTWVVFAQREPLSRLMSYFTREIRCTHRCTLT